MVIIVLSKGRCVCVFQIKSLDSSAPEIKQLQTLWRAELLPGNRNGIFLTSRELRAQDAHSREEDLTFHILRAPYFGYLENTSTGGQLEVHCTHLALLSKATNWGELHLLLLLDCQMLYQVSYSHPQCCPTHHMKVTQNNNHCSSCRRIRPAAFLSEGPEQEGHRLCD